MRGSPMLARIMSLQRSFLMSITFKHSRIQVERVAFRSDRYAIHLPLRQRFEKTLHVAHRETPEQVANGVVGGKAIYPQQRMQGSVAAQPVGMGEALGAHQHRH